MPSQTKVSAPALDEAGLARAGLVHRRVAGAAGAGPGLDGVAGDLGALAGERRREDLPAVAVGAAGAAVARPHDADRAALVEAQQLGEPQLEPGGDPPRDRQRGARLAALDL